MKVLFDDSFLLMGTNYHKAEAKKIIKIIGKENPYWKKSDDDIRKNIKSRLKQIYRYYNIVDNNPRIELEPSNKHDKNAIKVMIDGNLAGYFPSELAKSLNRYFKYPSSYEIEAKLTGKGGQCKTLDDDLETVITENKEISFYLDLKITDVTAEKVGSFFKNLFNKI